MRRSAILLGLALVCAKQAGAVPAITWTEHTLTFTNLGGVEASATATGLATVHTSSSTSSHLSALTVGLAPSLAIDTSIPVTDPSAAPISSVVLNSVNLRPDLQGGVFGNISGAIANTNLGILPNTLPQTGSVILCLLDPPLPACSTQFSLELGATSAGMQVGGGVGGILTFGGVGPIRVSVVGAPYTVKTVSVANRTESGGFDVFSEHGFAHGPGSLTSSTALTSGALQVVTAQRIQTVGLGQNDLGGAFSRFRIHFLQVPEPGRALLFAAGAAGVLLLGRRRTRR